MPRPREAAVGPEAEPVHRRRRRRQAAEGEAGGAAGGRPQRREPPRCRGQGSAVLLRSVRQQVPGENLRGHPGEGARGRVVPAGAGRAAAPPGPGERERVRRAGVGQPSELQARRGARPMRVPNARKTRDTSSDFLPLRASSGYPARTPKHLGVVLYEVAVVLI